MFAPSPFKETSLALEQRTQMAIKAISDSASYHLKLQRNCIGLRNIDFDSPECGVLNERFFTLSESEIVIGDSQMQDSGGFILMARSLFQSPALKRVLTVDSVDQLTIGMVARRDYQALLCTSETSAEVDRTLSEVTAGRFYVSESLRARFQEIEAMPRSADLDALAGMPPRRFEVVARLGSGASVKGAARAMQRGHKGVDGQCFRAMRALSIGTRLEMCRLMIREGFLKP